MKKVGYTLFFAFYIFVLFLFKPRQDVVFAAINESQYLRLFENGNEFELCAKNNISYRGVYTISHDTVFLWSLEQEEFSTLIHNVGRTEDRANIPVKLIINKTTLQIESIDIAQFSAQILFDGRHRINKLFFLTNNLSPVSIPVK